MFRLQARVFDHFADCIISGEERCAKPHPQLYAALERRAGLSGQDLLFIDDRADNIAAARALGWHGHLFTDADALEADLVAHGLIA